MQHQHLYLFIGKHRQGLGNTFVSRDPGCWLLRAAMQTTAKRERHGNEGMETRVVCMGT